METKQHNYAKAEFAYKEFLAPSLKQAVKFLDIEQDFQILDAGCGPGAMFSHFAQYLGKGGHLFGVDNSDAHLEFASETTTRHQLESLVTLKKVDLTRELPFEDESFNIIWLSDVLFPDDLGDEIYPILNRLYKKLKANGKIAIFYGNWLRLTLLPGYSILEHYISVANELRKSTGYKWIAQLHPENALKWLNECGFSNCENRYFPTYYQSPLEDHIKLYIIYHLQSIYKRAIQFETDDFKVPKDQIAEFNRLIDIDKPDQFILNDPFYHCAAYPQLTVGIKIDH